MTGWEGVYLAGHQSQHHCRHSEALLLLRGYSPTWFGIALVVPQEDTDIFSDHDKTIRS